MKRPAAQPENSSHDDSSRGAPWFSGALRSHAGPIVAIICISGLLFFWGLGEAQLWDRDEPRNAGCAAEMMARGDWVVPIFNDELRHQKPVLLYWLMMSAYVPFGVNEFSARFWSALLAIGTALATFGIGRRLFDRATGFLAAIALSSSLMFCVAARAATPDSVLIFCASMAIYFYVRGIGPDLDLDHDERSTQDSKRWFTSQYGSSFIGMYVMLGLAVLAKGPVGFVLPMAIIGMFMLLKRLPNGSAGVAELPAEKHWLRRITATVGGALRPFAPVHFLKTLMAMKPFTGALIAFAIAAPWFVWVGLRTQGDFLELFFLTEHFGRATTAFENHTGGIWFYPLAMLVGFFPWSIFWLPVAIGIYVRRRTGLGVRQLKSGEVFCLCWIGVQVTAFSLAQTKLPSYVTPCYPALAILTAHALLQLGKLGVPQIVWKLATVSLALTGVAISVGFYFLADQYFANEKWLMLLGIPSLIAGVIGFLSLWRAGKTRTERLNRASKSQLEFVPARWLVSSFSVCAIVFCFSLFGVATSKISRYQDSQRILEIVSSSPEQVEIATYGALESSWVYYASKPIFELQTGEPSGSLVESNRAENWHRKPRLAASQFVLENPDAMIITTGQHWAELKKRLPDDFEIIETADYFLQDETLFLIGKSDSKVAALPSALEQDDQHGSSRHR